MINKIPTQMREADKIDIYFRRGCHTFIDYYKELCHNILSQNSLIKSGEELNVCGKKIGQTLFVLLRLIRVEIYSHLLLRKAKQ